MQLAFRKTNPCSRIRAYACSKPPVRRTELFPSFGIRLFPFPFTLFRSIKSKTPKEFHETPIDEILSAFYFPETAFEAETYGKVLFQYCEWHLYCGLSTK